MAWNRPKEVAMTIAAVTIAAPARREPTVPFSVDELPRRGLRPRPEGTSLRREDLRSGDGR